MGICYIKTIAPGTLLGMWRMTESWQELKTQIGLTAEEMHPLDLLKKDQRKLEWLSCRLLLEKMILLPPIVRHDSNRKPHLPGTDYHVSMSHSGEYANVYVSKSKPVGVDIQLMKPSISKGIDYFLNEEEQEWINANDNLLLHLIWSAKESAFKYAGYAELDLKKDLTIKPFKSNQNGKIEVVILNQGKTEELKMAFDTFDDYVLTWTL